MKYSEYSSKSKFAGSTAFYVILACCLIAIGGASWFAVSNYSNDDTSSGIISEDGSPQQDDTLSGIGSIAEPSADMPSADVAEPVKDEPYTSQTETPEPPPEPAPVAFSMPVQGEIIKNFNEKELQFSSTYGDMRIHTGIDIACESGTAVSSCGNGKILSTEESPVLGNVVTVDHENGITAKYASLEDLKYKVGDSVKVGDIIGIVATIPSECADQSHLHLEVYKDGHLAPPLSTFGLE